MVTFWVAALIAIVSANSTHSEKLAQDQASSEPEIVRIDAKLDHGFIYPFYLNLPAHARESHSSTYTFLILPNNTGTADDDFDVHDRAARDLAVHRRWFATNPSLIALVPAFPRPKSDELMYTHALNRKTLMTRAPEYLRLDLQLLAMVEYAQKQLASEGIALNDKFFVAGFSASGMFANRFVLLHPEKIMAAAIGSPGGWPTVPVDRWKGKPLRYPVGTADLKAVVGHSLDRTALRNVPILFFLGSADDNDSVVFRDSFEEEDQKLVFELFGNTLQGRWAIAQSIWGQAGYRLAQFKMYPGMGHVVNNQTAKDTTAFFGSVLGAASP